MSTCTRYTFLILYKLIMHHGRPAHFDMEGFLESWPRYAAYKVIKVMVTFHNTGTQHKMNHFQVMSTHVTSNEEKCPSKGNFGMLVLLLINLTKIYITKGFVLYVSRAGTKLDPAELMRLFWVRCFSLVIYLREVLGWKHLPHVVFYEEYCSLRMLSSSTCYTVHTD